MNEIRIQKIDGVEFVTYKDYLRLKEEKEKMLEEIKILKQSIMQDEWGIIPKLEEENKKLQEEIKNHKQNIMQDELEIIPKLEEENKELRKENKKLENKLLKLCGRICENIDKGKRKEYQEFCNRHKI